MSKISDWLTGMVLSFFKKRKKKNPKPSNFKSLSKRRGKQKTPTSHSLKKQVPNHVSPAL